MIVKVKGRKRGSWRQLITYVLHDTERVPDSRVILHNLPDGSIDDWVGWFKHNETFRENRRRNSVKLTHEILSFHPKDKDQLTLEKLEDIAREYIERRGPRGVYLGAIHLAKDHYHIHFCVSGVEYRSGQAMRLSKQEMKTLKQGLQDYQRERYPELVHSLAKHGRRGLNLSDREYRWQQKEGKLSTKQRLHLVLTSAYEAAKDIDDFLGELAEQGLAVYLRRGKPTGVEYEGRRYRFRTLGISKEQFERLVERSRELKIER